MDARALNSMYALPRAGRRWSVTTPRLGKLPLRAQPASQLPQLPRLSQVLRRYGERAFLDIELKVENLESKVFAALHEYPPRRDM